MSATKLIPFIALLIGLPLAVYMTLQTVKLWPKAAVGGSQIYFSPSDTTLPPDRTLDVMLDAKTNHISFVHVEFTFDKNKVHLADEIQTTQALKTVVQKSSKADANAAGRAIVVLALAPADLANSPSGNFSVATFSVTAVTTSNTTDQLVFDPTHLQVIDISASAVTVTPVNANLALNAPGGTPTPTPTGVPGTNPPLCGQSSIPPGTGPAPLTVTLHGAGSAGNGPGFDGYRWDFENDGVWDTGILIDPVTHTYTTPGTYHPKFQVHGVNNVWSTLCDYPYNIVVQDAGSTPTLPPGAVRLKLRLQGITKKAADLSTLVVIKSGTQVIKTYQNIVASDDSTGVYSVILTAIPTGTYDLLVKTPGHLQRKFPSVTLGPNVGTLDLTGDHVTITH